jgi:hypothetical protein
MRGKRFVSPGPLWWGFDWTGAIDHLKSCRQKAADEGGEDTDESQVVLPNTRGKASAGVLIDEIDKADTDVPNGLLEALGSRRFTPIDCDEVQARPDAPILYVLLPGERTFVTTWQS